MLTHPLQTVSLTSISYSIYLTPSLSLISQTWTVTL